MAASPQEDHRKIDDNQTRNYLKQDAIIIDVRTPEEFMGGHVVGSRNIPLNEIEPRLEEFTQFTQPIILCCASGNRSQKATDYLRQYDIDCINGGGWLTVNSLVRS